MPRQARKNLNTCFYHIMVQGINKEYIFNSEFLIQEYKKILFDKLNDSGITILSYCIMNNHAHLLLYSENISNLSKYMQKVNTTYSQFYNKLNKRVGYVFRDRYNSQEILDKNQLYNCIKYIHNNPVKAKMVKDIKNYKYSSYIEFLDLSKRKLINDKSILMIFNNENYKEEFYRIHNEKNNKDYFYDIKEKDINIFIKEIELKYNKSILELKDNKELVKHIIRRAREETDVKIVELANILDISKTKVWNYLQ